jgi:hypothetical protein
VITIEPVSAFEQRRELFQRLLQQLLRAIADGSRGDLVSHASSMVRRIYWARHYVRLWFLCARREAP